MKITTYILILLTTLLVTGCSPRNQLYQADPFYVFGTLVEVSIWGLFDNEQSEFQKQIRLTLRKVRN